jgi:hypothetical protein
VGEGSGGGLVWAALLVVGGFAPKPLLPCDPGGRETVQKRSRASDYLVDPGGRETLQKRSGLRPYVFERFPGHPVLEGSADPTGSQLHLGGGWRTMRNEWVCRVDAGPYERQVLSGSQLVVSFR